MAKNKEVMEKYFELWKQNNVLRLAIEKSCGTPVDTFNCLVSQKKESDKKLSKARLDLLKVFSPKTNILTFTSPWLFLYYKNKENGEDEVFVFPLRIGKKTSAERIAENVKRIGGLSKTVKKFAPNKTLCPYIDSEFLKTFWASFSSDVAVLCGESKELIVSEPKETDIVEPAFLVQDELEKNISTIIVDNAKKGTALKESKLSITQHAYLRWIQRVIGNTEIPSKEEILQNIKKDFSEAGFIYHKERDNTFFFLNKESMVIYCVKGKKLASLWKNDFGFSQEVNKAIVFKQVEHLANEKERISLETKRMLGLVNQSNLDCNSANMEIQEMKAEIERLKTAIQEREAFVVEKVEEKENLLAQTKELDRELLKEESILFKKFTASFGDDEEDDEVDLSEVDVIEGNSLKQKLSILGLFNGSSEGGLRFPSNKVKKCFATSSVC